MGWRSERDGASVAALREAGAVILGKTVLERLAEAERMTLDEYRRDLAERDKVRACYAELRSECDACISILPALYPGRTRHYHIKVQAPERPVLTTQLYFPDEPANRRDGLFRRDLAMRITEAPDGLAARFDFVLDMR